MKTLQIINIKNKELLPFIYVSSLEMPNRLRDQICQACDWSIPTFYRKIRGNERLSPAERKMIIQIAHREQRSLLAKMTKQYKRNP